MWLIILSDQLTIVALVGLYPTNKLIVRRLLHRRLAPLDPGHHSPGRHAVLAVVSHGCPPPKDRYLRVTHPSATDSRNCPCDLHVLSMPPAFALSQDQTLRFISIRAHAQISTNRPELMVRLFRHVSRHGQNKHFKAYCNALKENTLQRTSRLTTKFRLFSQNPEPNNQAANQPNTTNPQPCDWKSKASDTRAPPTYPFLASAIVKDHRNKHRPKPACAGYAGHPVSSAINPRLSPGANQKEPPSNQAKNLTPR